MDRRSIEELEKGDNHTEYIVCYNTVFHCFYLISMDVPVLVYVICKKDLVNGTEVVTLRTKGSDGVNEASNLRKSDVFTQPGQQIHKECRRYHTNLKSIKQHCDNPDLASAPRNLRSVVEKFTFKEHCLFCGQRAKLNDRKKGADVFPVRTGDFQRKIVSLCKERNDEWALEILARIEFAQDLHAADSVYHQQCSVNFRTWKGVPQPRTPLAGKKTGRPRNLEAEEAFIKTMDHLKDQEEDQLSVIDLVKKMTELCADKAYTSVYMKKKIEDYFGDAAIITECNGKPNIVTLRKTIPSILNEFYSRPKTTDQEIEKLNIIKTAAKFIKSDIKEVKSSILEYPKASHIQTIGENLDYVPKSLQALLRHVFNVSDADVKVAAIGQAIMQAARPRSIIAPLQLGLGVQMHHHFGSRFLIDVLNSLGFSNSYTEICRFEMNAAVSLNSDVDIDNEHSDRLIQYIADNVDHDTRTLDGHGTFHGMGIIASITPQCKNIRVVPRKNVSISELRDLAKIDIEFYNVNQAKSTTKLTFDRLNIPIADDTSFATNLLSSIVWPKREMSWSALAQVVQTGNHPGKSGIVFLPMIDMDPTDTTCIYSTLKYVAKQAQKQLSTPIITFDQPLYWKTMIIINKEPPGSILKSIVLRLGGFHTIMSFLGSIGNLMSGSGLTEVLETVYAPLTVSHMMTGKAVSRAIRGHSLVYTSLTAIIVSSIYDLPCPYMNSDDNAYLTNATDNDSANSSQSLEVPDPEIEETIVQTDCLPRDINNVIQLYDDLLESKVKLESLSEHQTLQTINQKIRTYKSAHSHLRTSCLWIQYMEMIQILRRAIGSSICLQ